LEGSEVDGQDISNQSTLSAYLGILSPISCSHGHPDEHVQEASPDGERHENDGWMTAEHLLLLFMQLVF